MAQLSQFPEVQLVAVCDVVPAARDAAGDEFAASRRYASVDELLDAETLDARFARDRPPMKGGGCVQE